MFCAYLYVLAAGFVLVHLLSFPLHYYLELRFFSVLKLLFFTFFWRNLCVFFGVFSLLRGFFVAISVDNLFAHMQIDLFLINSTDMPKKRKRCTEPALYCDVCLQNLHCIGCEKSLTKVDLVHIRKKHPVLVLSCE